MMNKPNLFGSLESVVPCLQPPERKHFVQSGWEALCKGVARVQDCNNLSFSTPIPLNSVKRSRKLFWVGIFNMFCRICFC